MFLNAKAIVQKRIRKEAREREQQEQAIIKEERRRIRMEMQAERDRSRQEREEARAKREEELAQLEKEQRAQRKAEAAAAKRRAVSLNEMLANLEATSGGLEVLSSAQRVRRSMVQSSTATASTSSSAASSMGGNGAVASGGTAEEGVAERSRQAKKTSREKDKSRVMDILLAFRALLHSKNYDDSNQLSSSTSRGRSNRKRARGSRPGDSSEDEAKSTSKLASSSHAISISQLYVDLYDYLCVGGHVESEEVVYTLEHDLPIQVLRMLLSRYAPVEIYRSGQHGRTLMHIAAEHNKHKALGYIHAHWATRQEALTMLMRRVDLATVKDYHKSTPVHIACEMGHYKCLIALHKLKCSLNERDNGGYTPLMWCASSDSLRCAYYLIRNGADITAEVRGCR